MCWQPFRGHFTRLSDAGRALLEKPFATARDRPAPRDATLPLLLAAWADLRFWPEALNLPRLLQAGDIVFLTSLFPDNRLGCLSRLADSPARLLAIFHDAIPLRDDRVPAWEKARHVKTLKLLSRLSRVLAVSRSAAGELGELWREHGFAEAPISVLPWPVPFAAPQPAFFPPPRNPARALYVSRLKQVKNHATLFAACESLWREGLAFELELIGCEDERAESAVIRGEIARMQRAGRSLSWRAQVGEDELHEAYRRSTFTVFPSRMEGFGLPVIESLWHGRPVVCGSSGAVGELARDGGCLPAEVNDPAALAAAMRVLLTEEKTCTALARAGHARPWRTWSDYGRELRPLLEAA